MASLICLSCQNLEIKVPKCAHGRIIKFLKFYLSSYADVDTLPTLGIVQKL